MMASSAGRVVAGCFGLSAFAVGILSGLASENPTAQILLRALIAMLVCYPVGFIAGMICERIVNEQVEKHRKANPVVGASAERASQVHEVGKEDDSEVIVV